MCGICGYVDSSAPERRLQAMTDALQHRGRDDEGFFVAPGIALGMRRLSFIDRAHGQQPMTTDDGRLVLVFNGEIYNYRTLRRALEADGCRFRTDSDTEVVLRILERDGPDGAKRLEGMFCYALWNTQSQERLTLARDWLGRQSLYWIETAEGFAFASEIKALLTLPYVPRKLDVATYFYPKLPTGLVIYPLWD